MVAFQHIMRSALCVPMTQIVPRSPRLYDAGYLKWLRLRRCCVCGRHPPVEAAHIRIGITGMQRKPDDARALPLCAWCHREGPDAQHKGAELDFWNRFEIDPLALAAKLYAEYGGTGGKPRTRTTIRPRLPKHQRTKIAHRKDNAWPARKFAKRSAVKSSGS